MLTGADTMAEERLPFAQGGSEGFTGSSARCGGHFPHRRPAGRAGRRRHQSYIAGDIILGGDGSDIIKGRGGDDIIDGDKWLDVQIGVFAAGEYRTYRRGARAAQQHEDAGQRGCSRARSIPVS